MQKNKSNTTINTRKMDLQAVANDLFDEIKSRYSKITLFLKREKMVFLKQFMQIKKIRKTLMNFGA